MKRLFLAASLLFLIATAAAQTDELSLLKEAAKERQEVAEAVFAYPDEILETVFVVASKPASLSKIGGLRLQSERKFRELIDTYPKEVQAQVYELSRYPGLLRSLAGKKKRLESDIRVSLMSFPQEAQDKAVELAEEHADLLSELGELDTVVRDSFESLLSNESPENAKALRKLTEFPDILTLLIDNMDLTILLGEAYTADPDELWKRAKKKREELLAKESQADKDWSDKLNSDEVVLDELVASGKEFAQDVGYSELEVATEPTEEETISYAPIYQYPYSYWYGYPYWYPVRFWYRYPYWWWSGCRWNNALGWVAHRRPHIMHTSWQLNHPNALVRYPHFSDQIIHHAQNHRELRNGFNGQVRQWADGLNPQIREGLKNGSGTRADRIREYGKFEKKFRQANKLPQNAGRMDSNRLRDAGRKDLIGNMNKSRGEYLQKNRSNYPNLGTNKGQRRNVQKPRTSAPKRSTRTQQPRRSMRQYPSSSWNSRGRSRGPVFRGGGGFRGGGFRGRR